MWNENTKVSSWSLKQAWCLFAYKAQFKTPWNKPLTLLRPILIWSLLRKDMHCLRRGFNFCLCSIKKASVFLLLMAAMVKQHCTTSAVALLSGSQGGSHTVQHGQTPPLFNAAYVHLCSTFWLHSLPKVVDGKDESFPPRWENLPGPYLDSFLFWTHFSLQYGTKHFFLPWCSSVTCSGAPFHCCHAPGSLSHGGALGHSSAQQPGPVVPWALQAGMESRLWHLAAYKAHSSD